MSNDMERERFEAAMAAEGYELNPGRYSDGEYRSSQYGAGWAMWQAARATPAPAEAQAMLSELMRGLEIPPGAAMSAQALYVIGRAIADQAKAVAAPPTAGAERPTNYRTILENLMVWTAHNVPMDVWTLISRSEYWRDAFAATVVAASAPSDQPEQQR